MVAQINYMLFYRYIANKYYAMDKNVVDFVLLRIQSELDKYQKTKTLPYDLLEGAYNIDEIKNYYYEHLSTRHKKIADKLIKDYQQKMGNSVESLKHALRREYVSIIGNLETENHIFKFPSVMARYRPHINPVKALFYEMRLITRTYNSDNEYHMWLLGIIKDSEYNNKIVDALSVDIKRLEKIVSRYYLPLVKHNTAVPLELLHARQMIKDFRHYITTFIGIKDWDPDI
jgi:hypothetical protein